MTEGSISGEQSLHITSLGYMWLLTFSFTLCQLPGSTGNPPQQENSSHTSLFEGSSDEQWFSCLQDVQLRVQWTSQSFQNHDGKDDGSKIALELHLESQQTEWTQWTLFSSVTPSVKVPAVPKLGGKRRGWGEHLHTWNYNATPPAGLCSLVADSPSSSHHRSFDFQSVLQLWKLVPQIIRYKEVSVV